MPCHLYADGAGPSNANDEDTEMEDADDAPQPARAGGLSPAGGPSRRRHNPHAHGGTASDNEADDENDAGAKPARSGALDARQRTPPRHNGATGVLLGPYILHSHRSTDQGLRRTGSACDKVAP